MKHIIYFATAFRIYPAFECKIETAAQAKKNNATGYAKIKTYYDHRIAMAFLVMDLASKKKIIIDNLNCIKTSFPNFIPLMKSLGGIFSKKK